MAVPDVRPALEIEAPPSPQCGLARRTRQGPASATTGRSELTPSQPLNDLCAPKRLVQAPVAVGHLPPVERHTAGHLIFRIVNGVDAVLAAEPSVWESEWIAGTGWIATVLGLAVAVVTLALVGSRKSAFRRGVEVHTRTTASRDARAVAVSLDRISDKLQGGPSVRRAIELAGDWCKLVGEFESSSVVALSRRSFTWQSIDGADFGDVAAPAGSLAVADASLEERLSDALNHSVDLAKALTQAQSRACVLRFASSTLNVRRLLSANTVLLDADGGRDLHDDR